MKKLTITIELFLDEEITKENAKEIVHNVADAIWHQADTGMGLSPDDCETYVKKVNIVSDGIVQITEEIGVNGRNQKVFDLL